YRRRSGIIIRCVNKQPQVRAGGLGARRCLYAMPVDGDLGGLDCLTPQNTPASETLLDSQAHRNSGTTIVNKQITFAINCESGYWSTITNSFADKFTIIDPEFQNALSLIVADVDRIACRGN